MYFCHLGKFGIEVVHVFDGSRTSITSVVFPSDSVPGFALPHVIMRNLFVGVVVIVVVVIVVVAVVVVVVVVVQLTRFSEI